MSSISNKRFWLRFSGKILARYFQFVVKSSKMERGLDAYFDDLSKDLPAIFTFWHGEQFLIPTIYEKNMPYHALVSRNSDGEIQAAALDVFGVGAIRGSGGKARLKTLQKGGIKSSLEVLTTLENKISVGMTANIPRGPARKVGKGVVTLAKLSGRPIYPICYLTKHNMVLNSWDRAAINLPFSKCALGVGKPIFVQKTADEKEIESARLDVENELFKINRETRKLLGVPFKAESV